MSTRTRSFALVTVFCGSFPCLLACDDPAVAGLGAETERAVEFASSDPDEGAVLKQAGPLTLNGKVRDFELHGSETKAPEWDGGVIVGKKSPTWLDEWEDGSLRGPSVTILRCELFTLRCLIDDEAHTSERAAPNPAMCAVRNAPVCAAGQDTKYRTGFFSDCSASLPACFAQGQDAVSCAGRFAYCFSGGEGEFPEY